MAEDSTQVEPARVMNPKLVYALLKRTLKTPQEKVESCALELAVAMSDLQERASISCVCKHVSIYPHTKVSVTNAATFKESFFL
jgi:hypothetical protein